MTRTLLLVALLLLAACDRTDRGATTGEPVPAGTSGAPAASQQAWPAPGAQAINVQRSRDHDLTGDGRAERVTATAAGPAYPDLDITLVITGAAGDTLWLEAWRSDFYFHYDSMEGKSDEEIARIVQGHVDDLLTDRRFHARGMPPGMMGGDPTEMMLESVRYHLAELDWRRRVDLEPGDVTPADAHDRIDARSVAPERARVVMEELLQRPTYSYFAGGEASYVIGWSEREQSFVRLFACC
jgi:hypothetical protein